jgi:Tfp pilus assembly protein PilO
MEKTKQWAIVAVVAVVAVFAGGWFLLVSPQRSKASDVKTQVTSAQSANSQLQQQLASLVAQHKDRPKVQAQLNKLAQQLPANPGLPALVRALTDAADNAGVDLVSIAPTAPKAVVAAAPAATAPAPTADTSSTSTDTSTDASTTTSTTPTAAAPAAQSYGTLAQVPVAVKVNGSYFELEQFFSNLEAMKRPFLTGGFSIMPGNSIKHPDPTTKSTADGSDDTYYTGFANATISGSVFMIAPPVATPTTSTPTTAPVTPAQ